MTVSARSSFTKGIQETQWGMAEAVVAWEADTAYSLGNKVTNDDDINVYVCIYAGTSASSGGPTGTDSSIIDGTAVWAYLLPYAPFATDNTDGDAVQFPEYSRMSCQVTGAFNGATIALQGSNDGENFVTLTNLAGTAATLTAAGYIFVNTLVRYVRVALTVAGIDPTNVCATLIGQRNYLV